MQFSVGQTVIHPHHGPATVTGLMNRTIKGNVIEYVSLEVLASGMGVSVPVVTVDEVGIREVAAACDLARLTDVLAAESGLEETKWARRVKNQRIELGTGDPVRIAAVVRDLIRRREGKGLSLAEKDMLRDGVEPLVAEIALCVKSSEEQALEVLETIVTERSDAVLQRLGLLTAA